MAAAAAVAAAARVSDQEPFRRSSEHDQTSAQIAGCNDEHVTMRLCSMRLASHAVACSPVDAVAGIWRCGVG